MTIQDSLNSMQTPTMANFATLADALAGCATGAKVTSDAEWSAASAAAHALSVPGSIRDHIWTHI